jgi:xanthine dehydrogenase accessory factor
MPPADDDETILQAISGLDARGGWLFTVADTWGSSPRPAGSLLLVDAEGRETGSVSGGCIEADLVQRCRTGEFAAGPPILIRYGVDRDEARRFGLPCGGRLELIVERIGATEPWRRLAEHVHARRSMLRRLCLDTGEASLHRDRPDTLEFRFERNTAERVFGPRWRLVIIGAVHIAEHLVPIARALGYRVVVCDPRRERLIGLANLGTDLDDRMPDDCVAALADDPRCAVVALTHDPKLDDMALMQALAARAFYVGALGSRRTQQARRRRLAELGVSEQSIARLHGPVGLDLGGRTPAEIAVAIAAELVTCRTGLRIARRPRGGRPSVPQP